MTSGVFHSCPIDQIIVNRETRQRQEFKDEKILQDSIRRLGLIHPPVVTRDFILVAGERRLQCCKALGWTSISVQFVDELDERTLKRIELEENVKRKNLTWEEESRAIVELDEMYREEAAENIEPWTDEDTIQVMDIDRKTLYNHREAIAALEWKPELANAPNRSAVLTVYNNTKAREKDMAETGIFPQSDHIQCCSFLDWVRTYNGPKFNLIHCDFPFGIDSQNHHMGSRNEVGIGKYNDSFDYYKELLNTLCAALDSFTEESAHIVFWFSMRTYQYTFDRLSNYGGFEVDSYPLVWVKSDHAGILPDRTRGPRRIYETAFLARRGDRRIVQAKSNAYFGPHTDLIHQHEKPDEMLNYFFEMLVDENTTIFDPTCGGGSALRVAKRLGAQRILGLEIDEDYARQANIELAKLNGGGFT
jgi:ParB family transcriptional regulator, chromosome partitioning protein